LHARARHERKVVQSQNIRIAQVSNQEVKAEQLLLCGRISVNFGEEDNLGGGIDRLTVTILVFPVGLRIWHTLAEVHLVHVI